MTEYEVGTIVQDTDTTIAEFSYIKVNYSDKGWVPYEADKNPYIPGWMWETFFTEAEMVAGIQQGKLVVKK